MTRAFLSPVPFLSSFSLSGPCSAVNQAKARPHLLPRIHLDESDAVAGSHPSLPQTQQRCLQGTGTPPLLPVRTLQLYLCGGTHLKLALAFNARTSKRPACCNSHTLVPSPFAQQSSPFNNSNCSRHLRGIMESYHLGVEQGFTSHRNQLSFKSKTSLLLYLDQLF